MQSVHFFFQYVAIYLLFTSEVKSLPAKRALFAQDSRSTKSVTAVKRDGVIEYMKDAHDQNIAALFELYCRAHATNLSVNFFKMIAAIMAKVIAVTPLNSF